MASNFASTADPANPKSDLCKTNGGPDKETRHAGNTHKITVGCLRATSNRQQTQEPKDVKCDGSHVRHSMAVDSAEEFGKWDHVLICHVHDGSGANVNSRVDSTQSDNHNKNVHQMVSIVPPCVVKGHIDWRTERSHCAGELRRIIRNSNTVRQGKTQKDVDDPDQGLSHGDWDGPNRVFRFSSIQRHKLNTHICSGAIDNGTCKRLHGGLVCPWSLEVPKSKGRGTFNSSAHVDNSENVERGESKKLDNGQPVFCFSVACNT
ncbi:hypothetical protein OGATHE_001285 [Ogataea polymorpha]|uniref:Uncharacterized protein n=1 Tax=Ogataea polymorpha TaxID=460523 RepID=A0A9P8PSE2_9ASCO|nr:hypothetical protein OGATHE_001285 [Ogataea polymorpha]